MTALSSQPVAFTLAFRKAANVVGLLRHAVPYERLEPCALSTTPALLTYECFGFILLKLSLQSLNLPKSKISEVSRLS